MKWSIGYIVLHLVAAKVSVANQQRRQYRPTPQGMEETEAECM